MKYTPIVLLSRVLSTFLLFCELAARLLFDPEEDKGWYKVVQNILVGSEDEEEVEERLGRGGGSAGEFGDVGLGKEDKERIW